MTTYFSAIFLGARQIKVCKNEVKSWYTGIILEEALGPLDFADPGKNTVNVGHQENVFCQAISWCEDIPFFSSCRVGLNVRILLRNCVLTFCV